jgi:pyridoxal 5'-phosphate synthase pdxS subunit
MIRTKGEAGTGDVSQAVLHMRMIQGQIRGLKGLDDLQLMEVARDIEADVELVRECARIEPLPVVNFAAGGVATPADAALMMQLGADGVFVGSGIFKSENPQAMANAIVQAVHNYDDAALLAEVSKGLGAAMKGLDAASIPESEALQTRGW